MNTKSTVEYKMTETMAKVILNARKNKKSDPQEYLVNYVNTQMGLLHPCVRVLTF